MKRLLIATLVAAYAFGTVAYAVTESMPPTPAGAQTPLLFAQDWAVRLPNETAVVFRGALNSQAAGGSTGAMLYPAPNAGVALAALLVHGLLNSGARKMEANRLQETADKVLDPYRATIGNMRHDELFQMASQQKRRPGAMRIAVPGEAPSGEWFFVIDPVFSMTQDQRALIFDSIILVYAPNEPAKPVFQNAVRTISAPLVKQDAAVYWSEAQGKNLKHVSAALTAMALEIAAGNIAHSAPMESEAANPAQRTIRYLEGGSEKIERSELLGVACDRALLKTLRGALMSVPLSATHRYAVAPEVEDCGASVVR